MIHYIRTFLTEDQEYFLSSKSEITAQNHRMLVDSCFVYAAVLIFYTTITTLTQQPEVLRRMYYVFDCIHVVLCAGIFVHSKKYKTEYHSTQILCVLLELSILGFFALEGVYTSKTEHSLYIPIAILLILLLFIHRAVYTNIITLVYLLTYGILAYSYKVPAAFENDLNIAVATGISATVGYILIAKIRHKEGAALCKYENLSRIDQLTQLLNKAAIMNMGNQILAQPDHACAFMILDLDNFKHVNDQYGHDVGDEVLSKVGAALRRSFRDTDYLGRFGGDEFIILMDNCSDRNIIKGRVESIISAISNLEFTQSDLQIQCSVGIAMKRNDDDFQTLFKRADQALYDAKSKGKGNYQIAQDWVNR